ncbi:reverse transcriptase domain-containing protein [Tanacetum coccineum]
MTKDVEEWVKAGIVRPVRYPTWISNPVLVKKGDGSWRMCIDFKNLNSACPKDYYPLPDINGKIKAVVGFRYKCFLDTYKGYHQMQMAQDGEEKTACYTNQELPLLTTPRREETLYVYLAAIGDAVSVVLLTERNEKQFPINYVSRTLNEAERNYAPLEKLALSLLHMSRRNAIKGQILVDFLLESPVGTFPEAFFRVPARVQNQDDVEKWTLFTDGASNNKGSGAGLVLISPNGAELTYAFRLKFTSTNNEAEYEALLPGLRMAAK